MIKRFALWLCVLAVLGLSFPTICVAEEYSAGDTIVFGHYPHGGDGEIEPIEWIVLEIDEDGCYLLISKYALDAKPYNDTYTEVTWQTCTLRTWLNDDFLNSAFTDDEQEKIVISTVSADNNPSWTYGGLAGSDTEDRVYLLSMTEAERYFETAMERRCAPTDYVLSQGVETSSKTPDGKAACFWLLRTPGVSQDLVCQVQPIGTIFDAGAPVKKPSHLKNSCIRPVVRVCF